MAEGAVALYFSRLGTRLYAHERKALITVATAIAQIKGWDFTGSYQEERRRFDHMFFVPDDTLMLDEALALSIHGPDDFFGGVVPYPFVKSKAISHQLIDNSAARPEGWSAVFAEGVQNAVLPGYTAFSANDAHRAAARLLCRGPIRVKKPLAAGGRGQRTIARAHQLNEFLDTIAPEDMALCGVVVETQLCHVKTLSVGQITVDGLSLAYHGTQRIATDNAGRSVYGGSDLTCVRGGWDALGRIARAANVRLAVNQARRYDECTCAYPGFIASRRNYDVGQGTDANGEWRSGVFEASWRVGGASTAELAAAAAFRRDPALQMVDASVVKQFGTSCETPPDAVVHYQDEDPEDGPITRYVRVTRTAP